MVVTIVIIIAAAIGGVWYWTKIKEDKSSEPPKDNRHAEIQEPILRNDDALPKPISHIKIPSEEPKEEDAPAAEPPLETAEEEKKEESEVSALPAEQSEPSDNYLEQPQPACYRIWFTCILLVQLLNQFRKLAVQHIPCSIEKSCNGRHSTVYGSYQGPCYIRTRIGIYRKRIAVIRSCLYSLSVSTLFIIFCQPALKRRMYSQ